MEEVFALEDWELSEGSVTGPGGHVKSTRITNVKGEPFGTAGRLFLLLLPPLQAQIPQCSPGGISD